MAKIWILYNRKKMKTLIIGKGEVGTALYKTLKPHYETYIQDKEAKDYSGIEVMHICFPFTSQFIESFRKYAKQYQPKYSVIHSTVPIGTSRKCGAYHSPVRGRHPNLKKSMTVFVKYLAPNNRKLRKYFEKAGIKIKTAKNQETTEALKLWDTTQFGSFIVLEKEIHKFCKEHKLDFDMVYTHANKTYNEGYTKMGMKYVIRPTLKHIKGPVGGHCVVQNCHLFNNPISLFIKKLNKEYGK